MNEGGKALESGPTSRSSTRRSLVPRQAEQLDDVSVMPMLLTVDDAANLLRTTRRAIYAIHILRHTFCSHLAMRGAPARTIQELAGHQDLGTTQRYMHLSPAALDAAIRLLETGTDTSRVAVEK